MARKCCDLGSRGSRGGSSGHNRKPTIGNLIICKEEGFPPVTPGTQFPFTVTPPGGVQATLQVGECANAGTYPPGTQVVITEDPGAFLVNGIVVDPPDRAVNIDVPASEATVIVGPGDTRVTFTNIGGF